MADAQKLKRFHVEQEGDGFLLRLEDEGGGSFSVLATHDQLDLIADSLDDALDADEDSETVEDEEADEGEDEVKS